MINLTGQATKEMTKLRGQVQRFTKTSGDQLDDYTTRVSALSKTYGDSTDDILDAANALTKQLTGDFNQSLQLIEDGYLATGNASRDYLDQVREYPTFFREAGLSGEQMISIISQGVDEGVFSDKSVDLLKEFTIRVREMPKATKDAFNAIGTSSEEIGNIIENEGIGGAFIKVQSLMGEVREDSPIVGQALADIFGGPGEDAGVQFIRNLDLTRESLDDLLMVSDEYTRQLQDQYVANLELSEAQNEVSKQLSDTQNSLGIYVTKAKTLFFQLTSQVLKFFEQLPATGSGIAAAFRQIGTNISNFFNGLLINARITLRQLEKLNPLGRTNAQINEEIKDLRDKRDQIKETSRSVFEAYNEAFIEASKTADARKAAAAALLPAPSPTDIEQSAKKTVRDYAKAVDSELEKLREERANDTPVAQLGPTADAFSAPSQVQSDGSGTSQVDIESQLEILRNQHLQGLILEQEYEDRKFQLQQNAYNRRLEFLRLKFGEESQEYLRLENTKLEAQREYEMQREELTRRTEEIRQSLVQDGLKSFSDVIGVTKDLLGQDEKARKKNAGLLKGFAVGKIAVDTQEAIMSIIKNAEANPGNILFPGLAKILQGVKIASVLGKSALALSKVRKQSFYHGGPTGDKAIYHDKHGPVVGAVHANEWVAPEWMTKNPVSSPIIGWLESMRQRGFSEGGFTTVSTPTPTSTNVPISSDPTGTQFKQAFDQLVESNRLLVMEIRRKQFSVTATQVREAIDEDVRLDELSSF